MHIFNRIERIKTMHFDCGPRIIGKFYVVYSVLSAVFLSALALTTGVKLYAFDIAVIAIVTVPFALLGIYFWFFRRKPARRQVEIGTWSDDLYNRNRPLYVLYETAKSTLSLGCILAILYFIERHTGTVNPETDMERWQTWPLFFLWINFFNIANNVINRDAYYRHSINAHEYNGLNEPFLWRILWDDAKREWHF